jgi:hypothetical protein
MTYRLVTLLGSAVLVVQFGIFSGCSSGGGATTGTGGSGTASGTGGAAGGSNGGGGSTGSGACDKQNTAHPTGDQCVGVNNKAACVVGTDKDCWNTCGPNHSGVKNCTCVAGLWSCPTCDYDTTDPSKFACYKNAGSAACPPDPSDTSGNMLPGSGGACTQDPCKPCGSGAANSYRDSSGAPKAGWCICVPKTDGTGAVYSCASVKEWAPQCN